MNYTVEDFDNAHLGRKLSIKSPETDLPYLDLERNPSGIIPAGSVLLLQSDIKYTELLSPKTIKLCLQRSNIYAYWVRHNWEHMIDFTFKKGVDIVNERSPSMRGEFPLHIAIKYKHYDLVKKLVKIGADVNLRNSEGTTALEQAVIKKDTDLIKLLVELGASAEITNTDGQNAIDLAADPKIIDLLISFPPERGDRALCRIC